MPNNTILITGAAGFIGFHVAQRLLSDGREVVGVDSVNDYYNPKLKEARLELLKRNSKFTFVKRDLADRAASKSLFEHHRFPAVVHLAAQAGVRYSLQNPHAYVDANIEGFINVLEGCRHNGCKHLVFASSSPVYGANTKLPFSVQDNVDHPISLYAASKKANELMAHAYSHLYRIPAPACASSRSMAPGAARTWRCSSLPRRSSPASRSSSLTMARCGATLLISTMSARLSCA